MHLDNINRILIINLGGIGDLLLATPAVRALKTAFPDCRIDILLNGRCSAFMNSYRLFSSIHIYSERNLPGLLRLLWTLRRNRYDLLLNMRTMVSRSSAVKMRLLVHAVNPRISAGRNTEGHGNFFDVSIPEDYPGEQPEYRYDIELINALGIAVPDIDFPVPVSDGDRQHAAQLLHRVTKDRSEFIIGLNPGGHSSHRWPADRFAALAVLLLRDPAVRIVLTGSPQENALCRSVTAACAGERVIDCSGRTTVNQLAALLERFQLYITNDTGSMHINTAMNTPGIYLFGPGHIKRYGPFQNTNRFTVLHQHTACSPCEKMSCPTQECLRSISVDEVFGVAETLKGRIYAR